MRFSRYGRICLKSVSIYLLTLTKLHKSRNEPRSNLYGILDHLTQIIDIQFNLKMF